MTSSARLLSPLALLLALAGLPAAHAAGEAGRLAVREEPGALVVEFSGRTGDIGIPSWKAVLRQDDGGNLSALHVPADSPRSLSARETSQWPLAGLIANTRDPQLSATMSRGRESFSRFKAEKFQLAENSPEQIVIKLGGPSPHGYYEHDRTYTFTAAGIKIEGEVRALVELRGIGLWGLWDRRQIADSHSLELPMRTQGRPSWLYMAPTGRDDARPLPAGAAYPLEAELRLRRATPTFVRIFIDRTFESNENKPVLIHNNKDMPHDGGRSYEKLISINCGGVEKGQSQTYAIRFEFETQQWP